MKQLILRLLKGRTSQISLDEKLHTMRYSIHDHWPEIKITGLNVEDN